MPSLPRVFNAWLGHCPWLQRFSPPPPEVLLALEERQHDHDRLELSLTSDESMVSGARHTRAAFDQLLQSLPAQLPGLSIDCRSDTDGPLARSGR